MPCEIIQREDVPALFAGGLQVCGAAHVRASAAPFLQLLLETFMQGVPRTQVILADNALLAAFLQGDSTIGDELIEQVVTDRGLPDTEPMATPTIRKHARSKLTAIRRQK